MNRFYSSRHALVRIRSIWVQSTEREQTSKGALSTLIDIAPALGVLVSFAAGAAFWAHKLTQTQDAICQLERIHNEKLKVVEEKMNVLKAENKVVVAENKAKISVLKAENKVLQEKILTGLEMSRAEIAVAESRTMNKLLMYGFVEEYNKYQEKLFPSKFEVN